MPQCVQRIPLQMQNSREELQCQNSTHSHTRPSELSRTEPFGKLSFFSLTHPENERASQRDTEQISRFYESVTAGLLGTDLELSYDKYQDHLQISINLQQLYSLTNTLFCREEKKDSLCFSQLCNNNNNNR